jgi:hypothetical protein
MSDKPNTLPDGTPIDPDSLAGQALAFNEAATNMKDSLLQDTFVLVLKPAVDKFSAALVKFKRAFLDFT